MPSWIRVNLVVPNKILQLLSNNMKYQKILGVIIYLQFFHDAILGCTEWISMYQITYIIGIKFRYPIYYSIRGNIMYDLFQCNMNNFECSSFAAESMYYYMKIQLDNEQRLWSLALLLTHWKWWDSIPSSGVYLTMSYFCVLIFSQDLPWVFSILVMWM